ncbi:MULTISPECIES: hypothetical protein [Vibrio]|uniref:Cation transporter n=1 Tax=Vibrio aestuarianus TaxID=28171 RepID=A0A7X6N844_9VIBR|nr:MULTISPECIES: hypothetical protein [Vibrio]KOE87398.1 cation transporter [Vibrio alginolyticus]MBD1566345.1 hypothetical protein [Vibrio sp. S12_S33]MDE1209691.1 hypothetical protein [Vibrio aestuarianus]MDE1213554.1 hypothetical protein [Vibrio aestuarianus]MDE1216677.1 hypothetical protein [Vibrio aestuarianus]
MKRDAFGICLSRDMLFDNLHSTFTHVRAYELKTESNEDLRVLLAFPQMSGKDVLSTMQGSQKLEWRADYFCPSHHKH